jgi:hypothetical protein
MKKIIVMSIGYLIALMGMVATVWLPIEVTAIAIGGGLLIGGDATARLMKEVADND